MGSLWSVPCVTPNPTAVTLLLSAFPEMTAAAQAIMHQADEILVKPMDLLTLVQIIRQRVASGPQRKREIETVAAILERTTEAAISGMVQPGRSGTDADVDPHEPGRALRPSPRPVPRTCKPSSLRTAPSAVRKPLLQPLASMAPIASAAGTPLPCWWKKHAFCRSASSTLCKKNLVNIDYSVLLVGVMTIADGNRLPTRPSRKQLHRRDTADCVLAP